MIKTFLGRFQNKQDGDVLRDLSKQHAMRQENINQLAEQAYNNALSEARLKAVDGKRQAKVEISFGGSANVDDDLWKAVTEQTIRYFYDQNIRCYVGSNHPSNKDLRSDKRFVLEW